MRRVGARRRSKAMAVMDYLFVVGIIIAAFIVNSWEIHQAAILAKARYAGQRLMYQPGAGIWLIRRLFTAWMALPPSCMRRSLRS
jgi:hypothetical protein